MLHFEQVQLLAYSHTPISLEAGLKYRIEKRLTINGLLADFTNQSGVAALTAKEGAVLAGANDYDDIYLNGILFGTGRIERINFEGDIMVRTEKYTYEIVCYETGDLSNALSDVYQGLTWANAPKIESLSENLTYSEGERGERSWGHSLSVALSDYGAVNSGINIAKALASNFFSSTTGLGAFLGSYVDATNAKRLHTESYNLVDCSSSFSESVVIPATQTGNYSSSATYEVQLAADGFVTVTETMSIKGLSDPRYAGAVEGLAALKSGIYGRCDAVYSTYDFSSAPLFTEPVSISIAHNKFEGTISITAVCTNDPKYQVGAIWEHSIEGQLDEQNYYTITESGRVTGLGRPPTERFGNAQSFYTNTVAAGVAARILSFYANMSARALPLLEIKTSRSENRFNGSVSYSVTYTDSNLYSAGAIRKSELTVDLSPPAHVHQRYEIFNQAEIIQTQNTSTRGKASFTVNLRGQRGTGIATYLSAASNLISDNLPSGTDNFIESCKYSFSPRNNDFSMNLEYNYGGAYKEANDFSLT